MLEQVASGLEVVARARSGDLGVATLDEEASQMLQEMQEEAPLPTLAATKHLESCASTWYKGSYPLCRRPLLRAGRYAKNGTR